MLGLADHVALGTVCRRSSVNDYSIYLTALLKVDFAIGIKNTVSFSLGFPLWLLVLAKNDLEHSSSTSENPSHSAIYMICNINVLDVC